MNRRAFLQTAGALPALSWLPSIPLAAAAAAPAAGVAPAAVLAPRFGDGRDWWFQRRFGMFVHWGLYAITASMSRTSGVGASRAQSMRSWQSSGIL